MIKTIYGFRPCLWALLVFLSPLFCYTGTAQPPVNYGTGSVLNNFVPFRAGDANVIITNNSARIIASTTIVGGEYNFANFTIDSGVVLTVTGTVPLAIKVAGTATINGILTADGGDGTIGTTVGGNGGAGGGGGGTAGGKGGGFAQSGTSGTNFGTSAGAGKNGTYCTAGSGGGGGGYSTQGATGGTAANNCSGGAGGLSYGNANLDSIMNATVFLGGSGGGGGGGSATNCGGGGGGGGGGAIQLSAPTLTFGAYGKVTASGGNGGSGFINATYGPGGGGGGSGGTINLQFQSSNYYSGVNAFVKGGTGGPKGTGGVYTGGPGGNGATGRLLIQGPALVATPSFLDLGSVSVGSASLPQSYVLSGTTLSGAPGTVKVYSPTDFLISNSSSGPWADSLDVPFAADSLPGYTIWVKFVPSSSGSKSGNIFHAGGGANTLAVVTGTTILYPLFEQQFDSLLTGFGSGCTTSGLYTSSNPTASQFTSLCSSGRTISVTGGKLSLGTSMQNGNSSFSRNVDFKGPPNSLMIRMDFNYPSSGAVAANTTLMTFYTGAGVTTDAGTAPSPVNSKFMLRNPTASNTAWYAYDSVTIGTTYTSGQTFTWVLNKSGAPLTYKSPDGTDEMVADTSWDLWVGASRQFNDIPMKNAAIDLKQFKLIWENHTNYGGTFDNMLMDPIPLPPNANTATFATPDSFRANWNRVTNCNLVQASGYLLDVSTDSLFSTFVPGYEKLDVGDADS